MGRSQWFPPRWQWLAGSFLPFGLLLVTGCATTQWSNTQKGAAAGAAAGAGLGAIVGHQSGETGKGALIGAATGGLAGALIGDALGQSQTLKPAEGRSGYAPVTVEDVIAMSKAGIGDEVVIAKIRSSGTVFDLSADRIIEVKEAGVSDRVIRAMIRTPDEDYSYRQEDRRTAYGYRYAYGGHHGYPYGHHRYRHGHYGYYRSGYACDY